MTSRVTRANLNFTGSTGAVSVVPLIYNMFAHEYPAAVANARLSLIEFDNMKVDVTETEMPSPIMEHVYSRFWTPFARDVGYNIMCIAATPFRFVNETFVFEGRSYTMTVPRALERGGYDVSTYEDENGEKAYNVLPVSGRNMKGIIFGSDDPIYVVDSKYRNGISTYNQAIIDSDGGLLVDKWLETKDLRHSATKLVGLMTTPSIYIQKHQVTSFSDSAVENTRHGDLLGLSRESHVDGGSDVLPIGPAASITRNAVINTTLLPDGHILAPHQPARPDPRLLDYYNGKEAEFKELVDLVMKMHFQIIKADTGGLHSRSEAAVAEARSSTSAHVGELISDITSCVQTVFGLIYADRTVAVNVVLPCRSLATVDILWDMYANNMAPHNLVAEELAKMMNIDSSRLLLSSSEFSDADQMGQTGGNHKKKQAGQSSVTVSVTGTSKRKRAKSDDSDGSDGEESASASKRSGQEAQNKREKAGLRLSQPGKRGRSG